MKTVKGKDLDFLKVRYREVNKLAETSDDCLESQDKFTLLDESRIIKIKEFENECCFF